MAERGGHGAAGRLEPSPESMGDGIGTPELTGKPAMVPYRTAPHGIVPIYPIGRLTVRAALRDRSAY